MGTKYLRKIDGKAMVKLSLVMPETTLKLLDAESEKLGLTRSATLEKYLENSLPKLPGRPKK